MSATELIDKIFFYKVYEEDSVQYLLSSIGSPVHIVQFYFRVYFSLHTIVSRIMRIYIYIYILSTKLCLQ